MQVIAEGIDYLVDHYTENPSLEFLASRAGYDPDYYQKLFKAHVGISPKRLCQYMSLRHARPFLEAGQPTLLAAHEAGLSGNARLHDLFLSCEGVTPGEVKARGQGVHITYGFQPTSLGELMIGKTQRGICWLGFLMEGERDQGLARMHAYWPCARFTHDDAALAEEAAIISNLWSAEGGRAKLKLDIYGTNFQIQVWRALLEIPYGETRTYQEIAGQVGKPTASRAVGNAVGANPVSVLIPCHRVIRSTGIIDNYGWGSPRKKIILAVEGQITSD
ncbi:MAG: methylated-DNA--[protein]-cysteine S-methyltransferase [Alphaproteobacteria bacterium]|nr:methylated-DNA--[protein]-cysteine S-methyltransferase [Alphaproteobacteria bacterium]MCD8570667.1 methylated-DNA--[protein]-cysteine S-methyltransferase [Alphaproteobacteria bacterium]